MSKEQLTVVFSILLSYMVKTYDKVLVLSQQKSSLKQESKAESFSIIQLLIIISIAGSR